jgi:2'-5' RNA ligase
MRVFYAVEFNKSIKEKLFNTEKEIKSFCSGGNFTLIDNFHLTLRFIGERNPEQVEQLMNVLDRTADKLKSFDVRLSGIGRFPRNNKNIIWVGVPQNNDLLNVYSRLQKELSLIGYEEEGRPYSPHITIGREARIEDFEKMQNQIAFEDIAVKVNAISLMESTRIDNKLCYVQLKKSELVP